ncbi:rRNA maturation RNase YbeY [Reichenbachiella carrageenanivorans]|uniref:Endoribonuclease YbeY n=1 Tax=Reichenbachiella carrageenanivorans TaxID=2979869 RepID=A0ABY6D2P3_9BACT|nr:rRNA maturation RNase YbeY [Reichenbachiella carrageenanivorans]UXX80429.1 rRNA maturation RNase YbeY [Reichenbachiella carrageenanivorans]
MNQINFFSEDTDFELSHKEIISSWIIHTITTENHELSELNYIFCSDEYLLQINVDYLQHDYYTDVITFDNSEEESVIEGDIFISIDRISDYAQDQGIAFETELRRVIIHGVLHLVGYNDKTDDEQEEMTEKENAYLSLPQFQI